MGKRCSFLGFLASLLIAVFSTNAFGAVGYTCDKNYTSCNDGYYYTSSTKTCSLCSDLNNTTDSLSGTDTTSTSTCPGGETKTHATGTSQDYTKPCNGQYLGGAGGTNDSSACTGCSSYADDKVYGTCYVTSCDTGYHKNSDTNPTACVSDKISLIYELNGGDINPTPPSSIDYGETFSVSAPTHPHAAFAGWDISVDGTTIISGTKDTSFTNLRSNAGDVVFTATWTCDTGYVGDDCSYCIDSYYYDNGTCSSCDSLECGPITFDNQACDCSCSVDDGTCTCSNGKQSQTYACNYTGIAGGRNGAAKCKTSYQTYGDPIDVTQCIGDISIVCNKDHYLDDWACPSCPQKYPETDGTGSTSITQCFAMCVPDDVGGSILVEGRKYSDTSGTGDSSNTCSAVTCDANHCIAKGDNGLKVCIQKPENGSCTGDPDNPISCRDGYHLNDEETDCVANKYTITYSCGTGTGTTPGNQQVTFDDTYIAATPDSSTGCKKENYNFVGWSVSNTNPTDVKQAGETSTWTYLENKTFVAKYQQAINTCHGSTEDENANVITKGQYFDGTSCQTCPDAYPKSDDFAEGASQCYKTCSKTCTELGTPLHAVSGADNVEYYYYVSRGRNYNDGNDVCEAPELACGYQYFTCRNNYYLNLGIWDSNRIASGEDGHDRGCLSCGDVARDSENNAIYPLCDANNFDVYGGGPELCHTGNMPIRCMDILPPPTNADTENYPATACTYKGITTSLSGDLKTLNLSYDSSGYQYTTGAAYYPNAQVRVYTIAPDTTQPKGCYVDTCNCKPGYIYRAPDWQSQDLEYWDATDSGSCEPNTFTITLDDNGGSGGDGTIYEKYSVGWYSDAATTRGVTSVTKPTIANSLFQGYFDAKTGGNLVIPDTGTLPPSTVLTENKTLYAHWSEQKFQCQSGMTAANTTCRSGYYCPGGEVDSSLRNDDVSGCERKCPTDTGGGTITSPLGSTEITQCQTNRTGVELQDRTGGGNQVCNYVDDSDKEYKNCDSIKITYCNAGHWRVADDSSTCETVKPGNWSPAPTSVNDPVSVKRYSCNDLISGITATTSGNNAETSGLPTECHTTCPDENVYDADNNVIGSRAANPRLVYFNGTVDYATTPFTVSGGFPTCNYDAPVCNAGYHTVGNTCEPNVYEFRFNKDGGTGGDNGPIYMKYNTGWYSDAAATVAITSVTLPTKGAQNCTGYEATINATDVSVVNAMGVITKNTTLVNFDDYSTQHIELTASWVAKQMTHCDAGQYFSNADDACKPCPNGSWCEGGDAFSGDDRDGQDHYLNACPTATINTTYTPAQTWNGTSLVNVAPNVGSDGERKQVSDCFATVQYTADHGAGSQICHYAAGKYNSDCNTTQILTCNSGWWLDTNKTNVDCSRAGFQYYSEAYKTTRTRCDQAQYDVSDSRNTISTDGEESASSASCVREGIWERTPHGGRVKRCHWNPVSNSYSVNCGSSFTMRKCDSGYWDELGGATTDNAELDCVPVGKGNWSPAPANWDPTTTVDTYSTAKNACPVGVASDDLVSTTPDTQTDTSGAAKADCYLTCKPTKELNGTTANVVNEHIYYNEDDNAYPSCFYKTDECPEGFWCEGDNYYPCPKDSNNRPGTSDFVVGQKERPITECYILYNPYETSDASWGAYPTHKWAGLDGVIHGTGWVKAHYNTTTNDYTENRHVGALTCDAGYYYAGSTMCTEVNTCFYSPEQSFFTGDIATKDNPGESTKPFSCPAGCSGSTQKAARYSDCYKECPESTSDFPHSTVVASLDDNKRVFANSTTSYNACKYHITCQTGYDAKANDTASPYCAPHTYTITLDKNGGTGLTASSITCTFDSGECTLPSIIDTRTGHSTANKWCSNADGNGTCYDAGTIVTTNISTDGTDVTLYAKWTPNIYTITLNHNGAATAGVPATAYLKYATGWYSDAVATRQITALTQKPSKGVLTFAGYMGNGVGVIDSDGKFITTPAALTFTTTNTTVTAQWTDAPITCPAGKYYRGSGENPSTDCLTCSENNYCPGVTVVTNSGQAGIESCPDNGKSPIGSEGVSACYKENLPTYVATHGTGTQTCYYNETVPGYVDSCKDFVITACDGGYYLAAQNDTDCSVVDVSYYSGNGELQRHKCPNSGTTMPNNQTAKTVTECFKTNLPYTATDNSGTGTQSCWYTSGEETSAVYARECFDKVINKCRGGYYLANKLQDILCTPTQKGYYSIEDDVDQHKCEGDGTTVGIATADKGLCYEEGLAYIAEHGGGSQTCYWHEETSAYDISCGDKEITFCDGGYWLDLSVNRFDCVVVGYGAYSPNLAVWRNPCANGMTTLTETSDSESMCYLCPEGSVCEPGKNEKTCAELTAGQFTKSDAGTYDVAYCYRDCAAGDNVGTMSGRDYFTANDTCEIAACLPGFMLSNGQCVICPEGSYCDGTPGDDGDGEKSCADLGDGSWMYSASGSTQASDCYRKCEEHMLGNCTLTPIENVAYWPNDCQFTGTSASGNQAEVVNGVCIETSCTSDYEMINGVCEPCNRENAVAYKPDGNCMIESCNVGYHPNGDVCENDIRDCTENAPNATYAEQKWVPSRAAFGICTIKECEEDYHLASNSCVANEQACDVPNGTGIKNWNFDTKSWNPCVATSCIPGYTNNPYEKNNVSEQCSECRNKFSALGEIAVASYSNECDISACLYQGEKYNLDNNECVPICDKPYSDETGSLRWNNTTKKCERTCNPGYISW